MFYHWSWNQMNLISRRNQLTLPRSQLTLYPQTCNTVGIPRTAALSFIPSIPHNLLELFLSLTFCTVRLHRHKKAPQVMRKGSLPELGSPQLFSYSSLKSWGCRYHHIFSFFCSFMFPLTWPFPARSQILLQTIMAYLYFICCNVISIYFRFVILSYFPQISTDKLMSSQTIRTIIKCNAPYKYTVLIF